MFMMIILIQKVIHTVTHTYIKYVFVMSPSGWFKDFQVDSRFSAISHYDTDILSQVCCSLSFSFLLIFVYGLWLILVICVYIYSRLFIVLYLICQQTRINLKLMSNCFYNYYKCYSSYSIIYKYENCGVYYCHYNKEVTLFIIYFYSSTVIIKCCHVIVSDRVPIKVLNKTEANADASDFYKSNILNFGATLCLPSLNQVCCYHPLDRI